MSINEQAAPRAGWSPEKKRFAWIMAALGMLIVVIVTAVIVVVAVLHQQDVDRKIAACDQWPAGSMDYFYCVGRAQ